MRRFLILLATFFGVGHSPKAPGTVATIATIPLAIALGLLGPLPYMVLTVLLFPIGIVACQFYQQEYGDKDHPQIVIDEVVGYLIAMVWLPLTWRAILLSFLIFRLLDITKPLFIGYLDKKIHGGLGVMADDVAAGIITSIVMQILYTQTNWLGSQVLVP